MFILELYYRMADGTLALDQVPRCGCCFGFWLLQVRFPGDCADVARQERTTKAVAMESRNDNR